MWHGKKVTVQLQRSSTLAVARSAGSFGEGTCDDRPWQTGFTPSFSGRAFCAASPSRTRDARQHTSPSPDWE